MLVPGERVLVAVSGGKDSLALWDVLLDLGYAADGLYLGLGIGEYSDESGRLAKAYAESRAPTSWWSTCSTDHGFDIPGGAQVAKRAPCGACGLSKRHLFNQAALDGGYAVLGDGSQPRRRGGRPVRQHPALGRPTTSAASSRCCRRRPASSAR